ncbi:putative circularly permuted ATP-grasp superfamily protein/putative alpha-E superfamily protein [Pacificitalea manganoxidans]|nr:putative circularly permuted ATP-grasp superfamily protein/putative alpha-E superfamily protein [Pacificitalea manganoxidans]
MTDKREDTGRGAGLDDPRRAAPAPDAQTTTSAETGPEACDDGPMTTRLADMLAGYDRRPGIADELLGPDGQMRPVWQQFMCNLARQSPEAISEAFGRGDKYLRDAGVFFRHYSEDASTERDWPLSHVPVLIDAGEWAGIEAGLIQRAELLEHVMADLYGPGELVKSGQLPASLVAQNPEWLRPLVGITPPGGHFLHFLAFEIGRSPDGTWFVLGDRTQAPSGAGFALENRVATSRVFSEFYPRARVERLAPFFRTFRDALGELRLGHDSRIGILTPGQHNDTYFEHIYIARYLGIPLLEGEDLSVENGQAMIRTVEGPRPVSVLWRRLDGHMADPLELDEGSRLGTPGLIGALRSGQLTLVNALGSGVLESRAMLAFLPAIARSLLGAPLRLPNIATWWCGAEAERAYVGSHTDQMMIGPALSTTLPFEIDATTALGGRFRGIARPSIDAWIEAEGAQLVGQEAVTLSTTPAWVDGGLQPRPMTVRVFAARTAQGWRIMPGGYARIGRTEDATALAMQRGGSVADVWIVGDSPVASPAPATSAPQRSRSGALPSRAADNLFWLGRYVERAEATIRLVRAYQLRLAETGSPDDPLPAWLRAQAETIGLDLAQPVPEALNGLMDAAITCASKVRDRFSVDGWRALQDLAGSARRMRRSARAGDDAGQAMGVLLRKITGFSGLVHENMYRSSGWRFLTLGRSLERAEQMAASLAWLTASDAPEGSLGMAVEIGDSVMTHQRRYRGSSNPATVLDLLALDDRNPRSILFQLDDIRDQTDRLPGALRNGQRSDLSRAVLRLHTDLAICTPAELDPARLQALRGALGDLSSLLHAAYLS